MRAAKRPQSKEIISLSIFSLHLLLHLFCQYFFKKAKNCQFREKLYLLKNKLLQSLGDPAFVIAAGDIVSGLLDQVIAVAHGHAGAGKSKHV